MAHRATWAKTSKNADDAPKVSVGADLSTMSGLVAARRSMLAEDYRDRSSSSQPEVPKVMGRFPGSFKEGSDSLLQDQKPHTQVVGPNQKEDGRLSSKDPILVSSLTSPHSSFHSGLLLVIVSVSGYRDKRTKAFIVTIGKSNLCIFASVKYQGLVFILV